MKFRQIRRAIIHQVHCTEGIHFDCLPERYDILVDVSLPNIF